MYILTSGFRSRVCMLFGGEQQTGSKANPVVFQLQNRQHRLARAVRYVPPMTYNSEFSLRSTSTCRLAVQCARWRWRCRNINDKCPISFSPRFPRLLPWRTDGRYNRRCHDRGIPIDFRTDIRKQITNNNRNDRSLSDALANIDNRLIPDVVYNVTNSTEQIYRGRRALRGPGRANAASS